MLEQILFLLWIYCWIILAGLGIWLIIDGIGSIIKYESQSYIEHLVRVIRTIIGILLIIIAYTIHLYR